MEHPRVTLHWEDAAEHNGIGNAPLQPNEAVRPTEGPWTATFMKTWRLTKYRTVIKTTLPLVRFPGLLCRQAQKGTQEWHSIQSGYQWMAVVLLWGMPLSGALKAPQIRRGIEAAWWHWLRYSASVPERALCNSRDGIQPTRVLLGWGQVPQHTSGFLLVPGCKPQWSVNECQGPPTPLFPLARFLAGLKWMAQKSWEPSHYVSLPLMLSAWSEPCFWNTTAKFQHLLLFWKQVVLLCINTRRQ